MSKIVGDTGCPTCMAQGKDHTENHLMMFEDGGAYCNRCGHTANWKEQEIPLRERKELTDEQLREVLDEFKSCPTKPYTDRGISQETTERYGCRAGMHPSDRTKIGNYLLPFHAADAQGNLTITGYKVGIPKDQRKPNMPKYFNRGKVVDAVMFGQELLPKQPYRKLFITESPMDALALYESIKGSNKGTKWADLEPNVIALPHGTGSAVASVDRAKDVLKLAEEIILVFDPDKAGDDAVAKVKSLIPTAKVVRLPAMDCNDMLLAGQGTALAKLAMWGAETIRLDSVIDIGDIEDEVVKKPKWGKPYPWPTLTELTYGKRSKEIIGIAAGVGIGKSDTKYQMIVTDIEDPDVKVGVFDLEATEGKTGKAIVGKIKHMLLHKPDVEYDEEEIRQAIRDLKGRIKLYKHKGSRDWASVKQAMRHMVVVDGCSEIYLDNMTSLVSHVGTSEANELLNTIMGEIASMVEELDFNFIYYSHLNPPKTGPSHERGGKVHENQLTGSRAMIKWSHYIIGLERNKDPDLPEYERNTTTVVLLKDREFGNVGKFRIFYDKETGDLVEMFS
jgi:twinkle protein